MAGYHLPGEPTGNTDYSANPERPRGERTIQKIARLEAKIKACQTNPLQTIIETDELPVDAPDDDEGMAVEDAYLVGGKKKFALAHLKLDAWLNDLGDDKDKLISLFNDGKHVTSA